MSSSTSNALSSSQFLRQKRNYPNVDTDDPDALLGEWLGELDNLIGVSCTIFALQFSNADFAPGYFTLNSLYKESAYLTAKSAIAFRYMASYFTTLLLKTSILDSFLFAKMLQVLSKQMIFNTECTTES